MLPTPNSHVIYRAFEEGGVLLSTESEVYYGLNVVGARVWELLPPVSGTMEDLCAAVVRLFPEVDAAVISADVTELLDDLAANRLVSPATARP